MDSKVPTPVSGGGAEKGQPDGVNESAARSTGGESGGGSYDNPHEGKNGDSSFGGFMEHGGQTDIGYHGSGQAGSEGSDTANATTKGDDTAEQRNAEPKLKPTGPDQDFSADYPRDVMLAGRKVEVIDTSGIAAAEAAGTSGLEADVNARNAPSSG